MQKLKKKKEKDLMMPAPFSSSRWCPTPEQRMILKELYSRGITNPNSTQIQRITAHLSLYGKIHGKNVFYWFQNHKARDRQKLKKKPLIAISDQSHLPHYHQFCYSFADPLLVLQVSHDHHHACSSTAADHHHHHHHLPRYSHNFYHDSTFPPACCGNIRPLKTLQLFPLTSHLDHQNITASHL